MRRMFGWVVWPILVLLWGCSTALAQSRIDHFAFSSDAFDGNKVGASSDRAVQVYLPPSYDQSERAFPTLYYLHSFFEDETALFETYDGKARLDEAIASGALDHVIVVAADFSTPVGGGFYTSSSVTGDWLNFVAVDLVSEIDQTYRTLPQPSSRGIFGHHAGAYGAIRVASRRPDVFGAVYGMHPVATGHGNILMQSRPDWQALEDATSLADLDGNFLNQIFTIIYQANLPNPDRPPFYFDPPARVKDGELIIDAALTEVLQQSFFLERHVGDYAENLKSLRAFKFDWGRHDGNQDHVYSNQFYSRKLNEFGIPHEAEEYNGGWGDGMFNSGGRIETDVLPFFQRHLQFEEQ
ncbi:MAG: esterase family protein [Hyphomonadaceae bacterium]|nr:esterase family protein [Hyphomonadaceae bacterium]